MEINSFFYPHTCVVGRMSGSVNPSTGEEISDEIYSGICGLNFTTDGTSSLRSIDYKMFPTVIIPDNDVLFKVNDLITVSSDNGRISHGTIENFEPCKWVGMEGTTIWVKDFVDEQ